MILLNLTNNQIELLKLAVETFDSARYFHDNEFDRHDAMSELHTYIINEEERYFEDNIKR